MPTAAIYDTEAPRLSAEERDFFRDADPLGFILFADHCETADNVRALTDELREAVGREDVLFLIDQEGGRVARMKPPAFPAHPPMAVFGALYKLDPAKARDAARLNGLLLGRMISRLGVNVDCAPMLDVPQIDSDPVVMGDRAIAAHADQAADIGGAFMAGLKAGGALPVLKHLPGHGRALVDSHKELPRVSASLEDLRAVDFAPFRAHAGESLGMTAHVVYEAIDPDECATNSKPVIEGAVRGDIGFDGLLMSDDLKMKALEGDIGARARAAFAAGCDVALCCNFTLAEKTAAAAETPVLDGAAAARAARAFAELKSLPADDGAETDEAYRRLVGLIKPALA